VPLTASKDQVLEKMRDSALLGSLHAGSGAEREHAGESAGLRPVDRLKVEAVRERSARF